MEDGYFLVEAEMPVLLTAVKELNEPRYPYIKGIFEGFKGDKVKMVSAKDVNCDMDNVGLDGSPTNVIKSFTPPTKSRDLEMLEGTPAEQARKLIVRLREENLV